MLPQSAWTSGLTRATNRNQHRLFTLDRVFPSDTTQEQMFEELGKPTVRECLTAAPCAVGGA